MSDTVVTIAADLLVANLVPTQGSGGGSGDATSFYGVALDGATASDGEMYIRSGAQMVHRLLAVGDIPDISATYATHAALTGTGYWKSAGSFPPTFVSGVPWADLTGVSTATPTFAAVSTTGNLVVGGNLTVNGTTFTANSTVVDLADRIVHLNASTGIVPVPASPVGFSADRGSADGVTKRDMASLLWDEGNSRFVFAWNTAGGDSAIGADLAVKFAGAIVSGLTASRYVVTDPSKNLTSQQGIPLADLLNAGGAAGDVIYYDGANWVRLAKGTNGQALIIGASAPAWGTDFVDRTLTTTGTYKQTGTANASLTVSDKNAQYIIDADLTTTDATTTTIYSFTPPSDGVVRLYITIVADKSDGSSGYGCDMLAQYRVSGGTVTAIQDGAPINILGTLAVGTISTDTNGGLIRIRVTGIPGTVRWACFGTIVQRTTAA